MPWRFVVGCSLVGIVAGAIFGFVRGLHYMPTLVVAIIEGAVLFAVPAALLGLLFAACWSLATGLHRHMR